MTRPVALISGASRGIGYAVARRLQEEGWELSLGLRDPSKPPDGLSGAQTVRHDATQSDETQWVQKAQEYYGRLDAIVCCAGIMTPESVTDIGDAALDLMWEVNVKSPRRLVQAAWSSLGATGQGRVVLLASLSGKRVKSAKASSYAMTKHAVIALAHGIRQAGWDAGVRATAVSPGYVNTEMAHAITDFPTEKMTQPDDLAALVHTALTLPNTASVAELTLNCQPEEFF